MHVADDIPIQIARAEGDVTTALGAISEEKEDGNAPAANVGGGTPEIAPRRSLPKMAVNFGKKTKEKLSIKSSSSGNVTKTPVKPLFNGSDDFTEVEENGDLASELNSLSVSENNSEISTPINLRKSSGSTVDLDTTRSMQVSSV